MSRSNGMHGLDSLILLVARHLSCARGTKTDIQSAYQTARRRVTNLNLCRDMAYLTIHQPA